MSLNRILQLFSAGPSSRRNPALANASRLERFQPVGMTTAPTLMSDHHLEEYRHSEGVIGFSSVSVNTTSPRMV